MSDVKSIGILLFNGPDSADSGTVAGLSERALNRGLEVEIFMMHEAVLNSTNEKFIRLADSGAKITVCSHNSDQLEAERNEKFKYGSQYDHSNMILNVDRYLSFI